MRNEGDELVLYRDECCEASCSKTIREPKDDYYYAAKYFGSNRMEALQAAKKRGWKLGDKDVCPDCSKINDEAKGKRNDAQKRNHE